jgi:galactose oxidase
MEMPGPSSCIPFFPTLTPKGWSVTASSSSFGHPASAVLGSMSHGYWQSSRIGQGAGLPLTITITLPAPKAVSGLSYTPQSGLGEIGRFTVQLSTDGRRFSKKIAYGRWQANANTKQVAWVPRLVRAVRLTVWSVSPASARSVAASMISLYGRHTDRASAKHMGARSTQQADAMSTNPSVVGQWGPTIGFPLVPVAAALLPGNRLLLWSADEDLSFLQSPSSTSTQTALLDLTTGSVSSATVSSTAHDMFCPGVSILPNGDVAVTGGISSNQTSIYDPTKNIWTAGPQMNIGRGYQGQTTLSDGQAFVLGGSWSGALGGKLGEVFSPTGAWRELTKVPANPIYTNDAAGVYRADNHAWFFASSGGSVFQAGPSAEMHWITTTGAGSITNAAPRGTAGDEMNGNAVLYGINKILAFGGAPSYEQSNATNVANIVDISSGPGNTPQVTATSAMTYPRGFANGVALPNGQVFTVGGETRPITFDDSTSVMYPELWSPTSGKWGVMAQQGEPRNYHSVAVLLPDGTIFSGGGGLCGGCSVNHPDGQIFYPPYLFNADGSLATRPTIANAPGTAVTGQTISVTTGGSVQSFVLMRYDEATHTVDNDQRRIPLTISSQNGNTYTMTIPSDPGVALPGPYMLFALNAQGTPSVSATIVISTPALSTPADSYGQAIDADGPAMYWPLDDANGSSGARDLSGNRGTGVYGSTGVSYQTSSPVEGPNGKGVTVNGGTIIASQPQYPPSTYSEEVWFNTTSTSGGLLMRYGDSPTGNAGANDRIVYMTNTGQIDFGVYNGSSVVIQSARPFNDGRWHFLVATQGGDGMHLYVDGTQVASNTVSTSQAGYIGYWQLGGAVPGGWANQPTGAFNGSFSDAAVFRTELTLAQVVAENNAASVPSGGGGGGSLPSPWVSGDVGAATPAGSASFANGVFTVSGGGNDIWGTLDQFQYVDQPLTGDATITARVTSQTNSAGWAKAGVMIKQSTSSGSPYALLAVTPGNGIAFQYGFNADVGGGAYSFPGAWLRLTRKGSVITAYSSSDGSTWVQVGAATVNATDPVTIGLFVCSHNAASLSTATFDNVTVTTP